MAPNAELKEVQRFILHSILSTRKGMRSSSHYNWRLSPYSVPVSKYAKAYLKGKSTRDAARFHIRKEVVLCMDIVDFFGSISYGRVYNMFRDFGYNKGVSTLLANLCTVSDSLPQGAPTSPAISNIICQKMDDQIAKWAKAKKINYTRYADDLTFSGDFEASMVISRITKLLATYGFQVNTKKTRAMRRSQKQEVVGITVNEKMQVSRSLRRQFRQEAYYIAKFGMDRYRRPAHVDLSNDDYLAHLIGQASQAIFVNPKDEKLKGCLEIFRRELAKEKPPY
jgi:RNA-directed DNA polymerase